MNVRGSTVPLYARPAGCDIGAVMCQACGVTLRRAIGLAFVTVALAVALQGLLLIPSKGTRTQGVLPPIDQPADATVR